MRYPSIDLLRTAAIFLMVIVHFSENLSGVTWGLAGFGAPLFTFLVGVSYRLWLRSREEKNIDESDISKTTFRRGALLFVLGFLFNICVWLPDDTFNWDVLTLIGTGLILLNYVRRMPPPVVVFACLIIYVMGPILRIMTDYDAYWLEGYFDPDWTFSDILIGYFSNGYFPICPWLIFPFIGYLVGNYMFPTDTDEKPNPLKITWIGLFLLCLTGIGCIIRMCANDPQVTRAFGRWTMFPASAEYALGTLGLAMVCFSLGHRYIDQNPKFDESWRFVSFAKTFSSHSLSMYLLHHMLHLYPLWIYGWSMGQEGTHYWRQAFSVWLSLPLSFVCLGVCYALFRWMDRTKRHGIEGWMRKVCG